MSRQTKALSALLKMLGQRPDCWFWVPADTVWLCADTWCLLVEEDNEQSPEEQDQQDLALEASGWACCLALADLEDVLDNLYAQCSVPPEELIYKAINQFWKQDAFIQLD